jgi:hypothetical protein
METIKKQSNKIIQGTVEAPSQERSNLGERGGFATVAP